MKRASYREAVAWIVTNDRSDCIQDAFDFDPTVVSKQRTVRLAASLFGIEDGQVARDVVVARIRAREKTSLPALNETFPAIDKLKSDILHSHNLSQADKESARSALNVIAKECPQLLDGVHLESVRKNEINTLFNWSKTPQGYSYWASLYMKLRTEPQSNFDTKNDTIERLKVIVRKSRNLTEKEKDDACRELTLVAINYPNIVAYHEEFNTPTLQSAFYWDDTPQGYEYWQKLDLKLIYGPSDEPTHKSE
jgi:hypothetical protein